MPRTRSILTAIGFLLALTGVASCRTGDSVPAERPVPDSGPVIVVVADTLRADHLSLHGYPRATSPSLADWAQGGRVFERAFATAPWTLPSFGSLYTGHWPATHRAGLSNEGWFGRSSPSRLARSIPTVAERLRDLGFVTGAVMNNPYLDRSFGVARGFETYDHVPGDNSEIRRADVMVARALDLIDSWERQPFFLVLHLFDPHMDYDPPDAVRGRFSSEYPSQLTLPVAELGELRRGELDLSDSDIEFIRAAYDEEVLFLDRQMRQLRDGLEGRGLLDETLIIFTSDHGEELFDHNGFEHGHALWQELVRVPFVIWGPGVRAGRDTTPVSLVDVVPTILDWVGADVPMGLDGHSLWPHLTAGEPLADRTLFVDGLLYGPSLTAVVQWPYKMIADEDGRPLSIVDLDEDPAEQKNVLSRYPAVADALAGELHGYRRAAARAKVDTPDEAARPSEDILQRLRSLGYVR